MNYNEFAEKLINAGKSINVDISEEKSKKLFDYMNLLLEWNEKINLTAITQPDDIIIKHFIDSMTIEKHIDNKLSVVDVGTGAGFPGIPLSIVRDDLKIVLMDSLNKRIKFLDDVIDKCSIKNVDTIHSRAEELSRNKDYREKFDIATSRAVASLNVLLEYMIPFVKVGGYCICMKGSNIEEEVKGCKNALQQLNCSIEKIEEFNLPNSEYGRNIVIVKKNGPTSKKYPRKAGTPSKEPL
jgi:16S rRNA (guanine527-N7)-methyltransferase